MYQNQITYTIEISSPYLPFKCELIHVIDTRSGTGSVTE